MRFSTLVSSAITLFLSTGALSAMELDCTMSGQSYASDLLPHTARFSIDETDQSAQMVANGAALQGVIETESRRFIKLAFGPMQMRDQNGEHTVTLQLVYIKGSQQASVFTQLDGAATSLKATGYCLPQSVNI